LLRDDPIPFIYLLWCTPCNTRASHHHPLTFSSVWLHPRSLSSAPPSSTTTLLCALTHCPSLRFFKFPYASPTLETCQPAPRVALPWRTGGFTHASYPIGSSYCLGSSLARHVASRKIGTWVLVAKHRQMTKPIGIKV
jgi:hypothetical protein